MKLGTRVPKSKALLVALRIAVMDPTLHSSLTERLAAVPVTPPVTCRLWLKQAPFHLDNEGYINSRARLMILKWRDFSMQRKPNEMK